MPVGLSNTKGELIFSKERIISLSWNISLLMMKKELMLEL